MGKAAIGFTLPQKKWILERDGFRCQMRWVQNGKWVRCNNRFGLQVHHRVPRGWASAHYPSDYGINDCSNGITICSCHHIGEGVDNENAPHVIHRDNIHAKREYRKGNKRAYDEMIENRKNLTRRGIPYWNTEYDEMFARIIARENERFLKKKPYPKHRKYGVRGR